MSKIFIGIIFALGLFTFFLWNENSKLAELNQAFELRDKEQKLALETVQNDFALQTSSLKDLQSKNNAIELEMSRYLDIFKRHNLTKLANAKPSLIETRVNNGTKKVFDGIEADSRRIDSLDDGLQLQSDSQ
jgi:hypothetical protein|tara:strand:+ start:474 stop:869 length:396 start_codon:yes stop_codon:yes gene_type:complete